MRPVAWPAERAEMASPPAFRSAVTELRHGVQEQRRLRPALAFEDQPPPRKLAPHAAATGAIAHDGDAEVGWGSFVLLYDPAGQPAWEGPFRVIAYIRAELEPEIAADPLIGQVGWSWLTEALDKRASGHRQLSGTVTRVVTEGFGAKSGEPMTTGFELRASWSPAARPGLDGHLAAWCDALCMASGLPPATGVSALRPAGRRRHR